MGKNEFPRLSKLPALKRPRNAAKTTAVPVAKPSPSPAAGMAAGAPAKAKRTMAGTLKKGRAGTAKSMGVTKKKLKVVLRKPDTTKKAKALAKSKPSKAMATD